MNNLAFIHSNIAYKPGGGGNITPGEGRVFTAILRDVFLGKGE